MKIVSFLIQWIVVLAVLYFLLMGFSFRLHISVLPVMPGYLVILFAFTIAFMWVEILKWGVTKPFNCVKCMSGWLALVIAGLFHTPFWYFYLPLGLFVGSMWSAIKMRWL
jgi:hypothetical protein